MCQETIHLGTIQTTVETAEQVADIVKQYTNELINLVQALTGKKTTLAVNSRGYVYTKVKEDEAAFGRIPQWYTGAFKTVDVRTIAFDIKQEELPEREVTASDGRALDGDIQVDEEGNPLLDNNDEPMRIPKKHPAMIAVYVHAYSMHSES